MSETNLFRPALLIGLITAGLISFAAFIVLLGWSEGMGSGGGRANASSVSATGFQALVQLSDEFIPTRLVAPDEELEEANLLLVPLEAHSKPSDVEQLLRRRSGQPTLLILPKWRVVPHERRRGWVRAQGPWESAKANLLMGQEFSVELLSGPIGRGGIRSRGLLEGVAVKLPEAPQVIHGEAVTMLIGIPGEGALVAQLGEEPHFVVADPDLLNNHGLRDPAAARAAVAMLGRMAAEDDSEILFATRSGALGRNLLRTMFEPPFLAMTLALLAAGFLAGIHGAARFGPARRAARAIPFGKTALVENSAGLVRMAGREVRLGAGYADVVREDAARAGAAPATLQGEALEAYLDRFRRPGEPSFSALAHDVRNARDRGKLVAAARALFRWKKDMIR